MNKQELRTKLLEIEEQRNKILDKISPLGLRKHELQLQLSELKAKLNWNSPEFKRRKTEILRESQDVVVEIAKLKSEQRKFAFKEEKIKLSIHDAQEYTGDFAQQIEDDIKESYEKKIKDLIKENTFLFEKIALLKNIVKPIMYYVQKTDTTKDQLLINHNGTEIWKTDLIKISEYIKELNSDV